MSNKDGLPASPEGADACNKETIVLDEQLNISMASVFYKRLLAVKPSQSGIILDGSRVEVIDTSVAQLLVCFIKKLQAQDAVVSWHQPSDKLCTTVKLLGLESHLQLTTAN